MTTTKGEGLTLKQLEAHTRVKAYDNAGMDEGRFMLTLTEGWAFDAPVTEAGGDDRATSHCRSFGSQKEAVAALRTVEPCLCARCTR